MISEKNHILFFVFIIGLWLSSCGSMKDVDSDSKPVSHELWDSLVREYVDIHGWVNYEGFIGDSIKLNKYLKILEGNHPNKKFWSKEERLAFWINAYNAFTVQLIVKNYPVKSIKDIKNGIPFVNTVWDIKFINIGGIEYDLNNIEHNIIRPKFNDARIHFAVNCASYSCPKLRNEAFTAERLDEQLDDAARQFVYDKLRNEITPDNPKLSKIFQWYGMDFKQEMPKIDFINQYLKEKDKIKENATIDYLEYNWNLNTKPVN